jgi:hypothetical protein
MDQEITYPELLCRAKRWGHVPVDLAQCSSLAVHRFVILDGTLPEFRFWLIQAGFPFL